MPCPGPDMRYRAPGNYGERIRNQHMGFGEPGRVRYRNQPYGTKKTRMRAPDGERKEARN